jgi:hypothetical protein
MIYRRLILISIAIFITACAPGLARAENTPSATPPPATEPVCQPSPILTDYVFPEIQATMHSEGEIWALLFFEEARANEELKIVWRITAVGPGTDLNFQAQKEEGTLVQPIWGPEFHPESTWERPGLEWGTGFNFPEPGCWTITVTLGATEGEISLDVVDK